MKTSIPTTAVESAFPKSGIRPLGDIHAVERSLNSCRSTVEKLLRTDPEFPAPMDIAKKRQWFMDEIETYKATRPRRQYADSAA